MALSGSCLCGGVAFTADPPLRGVVTCHCTQCRKTSGHLWATTSVPLSQFHLLAQDSLRWFRSSDQAERGFCATCGSSLFWRPTGEDCISIAAGAFDGPTGLKIAEHIYVADKGDYYAVPDDAPHDPGWGSPD
ncbi:MAG: GFA family protein [Deltaproteobacteria bacterium]